MVQQIYSHLDRWTDIHQEKYRSRHPGICTNKHLDIWGDIKTSTLPDIQRDVKTSRHTDRHRQRYPHIYPYKHPDIHTDIHTSKHTSQQTERQPKIQTDAYTNKQTFRQTDRPTQTFILTLFRQRQTDIWTSKQIDIQKKPQDAQINRQLKIQTDIQTKSIQTAIHPDSH